MSTKKICLFLFTVLVILTSNSTLNAKTELASKKSSLQKTINVQLLQVFIIEKDAKEKDILKLYEKGNYEFIFFQYQNNKPKVRREKGSYSWRSAILKLEKKGDAEIKEHAFKFEFDSLQGKLIPVGKLGIKKDFLNALTLSKDQKYWQETYQDNLFGEITNNFNASQKIVPPKKQEIEKIKELKQQDTINLLLSKIQSDTVMLTKDILKYLKVVMVVGPVEEDTKEFIKEQKINAEFLRKMGLNVIEMFHPNARWEDVVSASEGAHIFIYSGHGSNLGINHPTGGLCLSDGIFHSNEIVKQFKLHKNALVIFNHVCGGAGSSAYDIKDIGVNEALARVGEYAYPFFKTSASAYYANNYSECLIPFFEQFLRKQPIKKIYTKEATMYSKIECIKSYNYNSSLAIGISSRPATKEKITLIEYHNGRKKTKLIADFKNYDVAFVAPPDYSILNLLHE